MTSAGFNRRMRKTACPVVWKGHGAESPCPHPILMKSAVWGLGGSGATRTEVIINCWAQSSELTG